MKPSLLIVAHGSRRSESNDEVRTLTQRVRSISDNRFTAVTCAFLELASPSIPEGLEQLIHDGASHITVLPYFLAAGRHVVEDIPAEVASIQQTHPAIAIEIAPYLGTSATLPELMVEVGSGSSQAG